MTVEDDVQNEAFVWMQGRMVELLLRYDLRRFDTMFGEDTTQALDYTDPRIARHRLLAALFYLRTEFFDSILPRIKSRLSFAAPRHLTVEEPPARGRIDWARTATATLRDHPGQIPLAVYTRQRRRHFDTPENLLTVGTILEYRRLARHLLDTEAVVAGNQAIRHPLNDIIGTCTRELAFLQFAGLIPEATAIVEGKNSRSLDQLDHAVRLNLVPGHNTAYDDLLTWRQKLKQLQLLERKAEAASTPTLGTDPERDNYLYQVWLFYEFADLLTRKGCLEMWDRQKMHLRFSWGQGNQRRTYFLQHDQAIPKYWQGHVPAGSSLNPNRLSPGVRPDFYIEHADTSEIRDGNTLIWREPGYVLDAKYYKPRDAAMAPSSPVKRMVADLQLASQRYGALLFAFQGLPVDGVKTQPQETELEPDWSTESPQSQPLYTVAPAQVTAQTIQPDITIGIWRIQPRLAEQILVHQTLTAILDEVHAKLKERIEVRCHGIFIDTHTQNAHGNLTSVTELRSRNGATYAVPLTDLLLCPKPHVAPWRIDIVSRTHDCCKNAVLCHVKNIPGVHPPQHLSLNIKEAEKQNSNN